MKKFCLALMSIIFCLLPTSAYAVDNVDKTVCTLALGYEEIDEIKADLLTAAKREVVNELFGELIVASTAVENFVVTSDQIRASSIGFVRVDGNAEFFNGKGFVEACVTISAYVTEDDRAMFEPEKLEKKVCDSDDDLTTSQLIAYVKDEVIVQALEEFDPKLKGAERESLLQLVQRVTYSESSFIPDTQTYCARFEGYVVPVEIIALLDTTGDGKTGKEPSIEGLIFHYSFDKDDLDNLVIFGAKLVPDRFGNPQSAFQFDGIDDYAMTHEKVSFGASYTLSFWINASEDMSGSVIFMHGIAKQCLYEPVVSLNSSYNLIGAMSGCNGAGAIFADDFSTEKWHHIVFTVQPKLQNLYIDGQKMVSGQRNSKNTTARIIFGAGTADGVTPDLNFFPGVLDDVRIYNRVLTESEITSLYDIAD